MMTTHHGSQYSISDTAAICIHMCSLICVVIWVQYYALLLGLFLARKNCVYGSFTRSTRHVTETSSSFFGEGSGRGWQGRRGTQEGKKSVGMFVLVVRLVSSATRRQIGSAYGSMRRSASYAVREPSVIPLPFYGRFVIVFDLSSLDGRRVLRTSLRQRNHAQLV